MPLFTVPPLIVLIPLLIGGAWIGLRRGWKDEAWTTGALLVTLFVFARPETILLPTLERIISAFQRAGQALLGQDTSGPPFAFTGAARPLAQLMAFLLFVALAYAVGHLLGKSEQGGGLWKLLAILLGAVNLAIVLSWLVGNFIADRDIDGNVRLRIPAFDGAQIIVGTPSTNNLLSSWQSVLGLLAVIIVVVFLLTRSRVWR